MRLGKLTSPDLDPESHLLGPRLRTISRRASACVIWRARALYTPCTLYRVVMHRLFYVPYATLSAHLSPHLTILLTRSLSATRRSPAEHSPVQAN